MAFPPVAVGAGEVTAVVAVVVVVAAAAAAAAAVATSASKVLLDVIAVFEIAIVADYFASTNRHRTLD
jgi:hypothetical protein